MTVKTWEDSLPEGGESNYFKILDGEKKEITFKDEGEHIMKDNFGNEVIRFTVENEGMEKQWDIKIKNPLLRKIAELARPREDRKFLVSRKGSGQKDTRYDITEIEKK